MPDLADRARALLELHTAPEILVLANVWDVASAQVVAAYRGCAGPRDRQPLHRRHLRVRGRREHPLKPAPGHGRPDRRRGGPAGDHGLRGRLRRCRGDHPPRHRGRRRGRQPRGPDEAARPGGGRRGGRAAAGRDAGIDFVLNARTDARRPEGRRPRPARRGSDPPRARVPRGGRTGGLRPGTVPRDEIAALVDALGPRTSASSACQAVAPPARAAGPGRRPGVHRPVHPTGGPDRAARGPAALRRRRNVLPPG